MSEELKSKPIPAFPSEATYWNGIEMVREPVDGMTLRDFMAAKALVGCLPSYREGDCEPSMLELAKSCYAFADCMMEARK